jgi:DHA1 family inner membrane transport protein
VRQPSPTDPVARATAGRETAAQRPLPVALLLLLAAAVCAAVTTEMLPVGLLPSISAGLHVSESQVGLLVSGYAAVVAVASIPMAAALQRLPRRPVLAVLLAAYGVSNAVFAASTSYGLALAARLVAGLAHAAFFAVVVSAAVALVPRARAGRAVALVMSGTAVALAAGVPAGTALGTVLGWRWVFAGSAVLLLLLAAAVARLLPATPPAAAGHQPVLAALRQPRLLLIAAVIALFMIGHFTVYTYISPLLLYAGVTRVGVSAVLLGYGAAGIGGLVLAGSAADRHPRGALTLTMGLMAACLAGLWLGHATALTVIIVVIWGMTYGAVPTLTQSSALAAVPAAPDAGPAVVNAMTNVGISGGALIGARELAAGPVPALALTGAVLVAAALVLHAVPFPRAVFRRGARPAAGLARAVPAAGGAQRGAGRRRRRGGTSEGGAGSSSGSRDGGFTSSSRR